MDIYQKLCKEYNKDYLPLDDRIRIKNQIEKLSFFSKLRLFEYCKTYQKNQLQLYTTRILIEYFDTKNSCISILLCIF